MPEEALAQAYMDQLVAALEARGLEVEAKLPALTARRPGVTGTDPRGDILSPGMTQHVLIRLYEGRELTWCWVWPGPDSGERGAPTPEAEVEPMCPAADIEHAANRIAN
ncbi:MAG: hypothetical protein JWR24_1185, partial [Actinoallomurus sp.]|nr:hypothetical protein [Actinoallomurus sp.]